MSGFGVSATFFPNLLPQARLAGSFWKGDATAPRVEVVAALPCLFGG